LPLGESKRSYRLISNSVYGNAFQCVRLEMSIRPGRLGLEATLSECEKIEKEAGN
jgi:hypothetical protein